MKTKTRNASMSKKDAKSEVSELVKDTKQELRYISSVSQYDMVDVLEMFVGGLLKRVGFIQTGE